MKKITSLFMGLIVLATASFAQPKMVSKKAEKKVTSEAKMAPAVKTSTEVKMSSTEKMKQVPAAKPAPVIKMVPKADAKAAPLKKDGTPDKRFKAAKGAKSEGPVKKDGTPDMRFKKNKTRDKKAA